MQRDNTDQFVLIIDDGQELHRGWWSFHLFHCLDRHCIWTNDSWVPKLTKKLLVYNLCKSLLFLLVVTFYESQRLVFFFLRKCLGLELFFETAMYFKF